MYELRQVFGELWHRVEDQVGATVDEILLRHRTCGNGNCEGAACMPRFHAERGVFDNNGLRWECFYTLLSHEIWLGMWFAMLHIGGSDAQMLFEQALIFVIDAAQYVGLAAAGHEHAFYAFAFEARKHIVGSRHHIGAAHALKIACFYLIKAASLLDGRLRAKAATEKQVDSSHTRHTLVEIELIA